MFPVLCTGLTVNNLYLVNESMSVFLGVTTEFHALGKRFSIIAICRMCRLINTFFCCWRLFSYIISPEATTHLHPPQVGRRRNDRHSDIIFYCVVYGGREYVVFTCLVLRQLGN